MMWLGSPTNAARAEEEDRKAQDIADNPYLGDSLHPCPKCNYCMYMIAEHAFGELWECPQCGHMQRVKQ